MFVFSASCLPFKRATAFIKRMMVMKSYIMGLRQGAFALVVYLGGFVGSAAACDLCAIFNELSTDKPMSGAVRLSVAEQFSYFGKVQEDSHVYDDPANQHMASSITQMVGAYDISPRYSFQINLPYISRHYRRAEGGEIESGVEAGIGDLTLLGKAIVLDERGADWTVVGRFFGGIKLPTGDSDRIGEEFGEDHHHSHSLKHAGEEHGDEASDDASGEHSELEPVDAPMDSHDDHHHGGGEVATAVHGHDLALGSGSYDFPLGLALLGQYDRFFAHAEIQYLLRTEGDFDYRYANDLLWSFSPGVYLVSEHATTVSLAVDLSGEYKREDSIAGADLDDTAIRSIFIGPELRVTHGAWRAALVWEKPIDINNTGVQTVVTDRMRASLSYWF